MRLAGKVAVVTGGASGIGRATAQRFAREGAKMVVAGIQTDLASDEASFVNGSVIFVDDGAASFKK